MRSDLIFWDVNTQVDLMRSNGKLYIPDSESIIPALKQLTDHAHERGIRILASADDHIPEDPELSDTPDFRETFPQHCMRGTPGQQKIPETTLRHVLLIEPEPRDTTTLAAKVRNHDGDILFHKHSMDSFTNPNVLPVVHALAPARVVLYGVALDFCDRYIIEGLLQHRPGIRVALVTDAARALHADVAARLLRDWDQRGVQLLTARQVLAA